MATYQSVAAALGDPTRLAIVERLARRPLPVGELAAGLPVSRPAVSLHLRVLREAGLVRDHREGTRRIYRLDPDGLAALREFLDGLWTSALAAFAEVAEESGTAERADPGTGTGQAPGAGPAGRTAGAGQVTGDGRGSSRNELD
ncbi:MAG TPA: metalloregulator ArsR/SmtB family transcription factor [Pseudonocardiaceae bacterium]